MIRVRNTAPQFAPLFENGQLQMAAWEAYMETVYPGLGEILTTGDKLTMRDVPAGTYSLRYVAGSDVYALEGKQVVVPSSGLLSKSRNVTKGVKVEIGTEEASVDLYVTVEYGKPIQKAAHEVQEAVRKAIEEMTGLHVVRVDVHVQGVSFEKENKALNAGAQHAVLEREETAAPRVEAPAVAPAEVPAEAPAEEEAPAAEEKVEA